MKLIISFAVPLVFGSLFQQFYSMVDTIIVIFIGIPVTFLYNTLAGLLRGLGDSRTPVIFLVIASVLNIGLDLLLILVIPMGVAGAALATVFFVGRPLGLLFVDSNEAQILDWAHRFMLANAAFDVCLAAIFVLRTTIQGMVYSSVAMFNGLFEMVIRGIVGLWIVPAIGFSAACFAHRLGHGRLLLGSGVHICNAESPAGASFSRLIITLQKRGIRMYNPADDRYILAGK